MKIKEALNRRNENRPDQLRIIDLGQALWPDSKPETQKVNISNLVNGKTKSIPLESVGILCELLECDANYLFGEDEL